MANEALVASCILHNRKVLIDCVLNVLDGGCATVPLSHCKTYLWGSATSYFFQLVMGADGDLTPDLQVLKEDFMECGGSTRWEIVMTSAVYVLVVTAQSLYKDGLSWQDSLHSEAQGIAAVLVQHLMDAPQFLVCDYPGYGETSYEVRW